MEKRFDGHDGRDEPLDGIAGAGQLEIIKWIGKKVGGFFSSKATDLAAANGHLDVVKFFMEYKDLEEKCTHAAMDGAAKNGHLEIVKWLHENRSEGCTTAAMDGAARYGHLNVVKWLHKNRTEGCTIRAMDHSAGNGHLHVVQWLHENRDEGCTYSAVDWASNGGHLEVLKWLQRYRGMTASEESMDNALDLAASNRHVETLRWLYDTQMLDFTPSAMAYAAENGHFDMMLLLKDEYECEFVEYTLICAIRSNELEIVQWVCHHSHEAITRRIGREASYANIYIKKWLLETSRSLHASYWW